MNPVSKLLNKVSNLILIGPPGVGKTTIGRKLAQHFKLDFYDADREIEEKAGADIAWMMDVEGEAGFRKREAEMISHLTERKGIVLSTGGGAILDSDNRARLGGTGTVIYLKASVQQLLSRIEKSKQRPLLEGRDREAALTEMLAAREPLYQALADFTVDTNGKTVSEIFNAAVEFIELQ